MADAARILVVDDEAAQMKALCHTLHDQGYLTTGYPSAREALAALGTQKFDLLLTDLSMPGMDGISFLRAALELDADLVGIVMTGNGTIDTAVEAMKVGALDYILKPFKLSNILPVLSRALAMRQLRLDNAALTDRLRERTADLEAANRDLEAFSYSVAHDLRAPLRSMDSFGQILLEEFAPELPAEAQRLLRIVSSSARRMGQLIDDLLRFSRLGRQPLVREPVRIAALVDQVVSEQRGFHAGRDITVVVTALPDALGDPGLLRQVFVNLLSNAFKFTRGTEAASIEIGWKPLEGEALYFVRDNGAGFSPQFSEKLFGVFQRLHRAEEFEGTGIGLSIVQRIIQRHGGRIWAEAAVGQGATFFFTLPTGGDSAPAPDQKLTAALP